MNFDIGEPSEAFKANDTKEFAFESNGIAYYKHTQNGFSMTYQKFFELSTRSEYHEKWKLAEADVDEFFRVERDSISQIRALVASGQTDDALLFIDEFATYQAFMGIRRQLKHPEALYIEASVFYFDHTEDPARYDEIYAKTKIDRWLQDPELITNKELFFSPVSKLMLSPEWSMLTPEEMEIEMQSIYQTMQDGATTGVYLSEKAQTLLESIGTAGSTLRNMHLRAEILRQYEYLSGFLSRHT